MGVSDVPSVPAVAQVRSALSYVVMELLLFERGGGRGPTSAHDALTLWDVVSILASEGAYVRCISTPVAIHIAVAPHALNSRGWSDLY